MLVFLTAVIVTLMWQRKAREGRVETADFKFTGRSSNTVSRIIFGGFTVHFSKIRNIWDSERYGSGRWI